MRMGSALGPALGQCTSDSINILTTSRDLSAVANLNIGQDLITMSLKLALEINDHVQGYKPAFPD